MSEELTVLKEYFDSLNLNNKVLTKEDLKDLQTELSDAGEYGLAAWVSSLNEPSDLLDYLGEEDEV